MSRMRRTLSVLTSLGPAINYTLQATIPGHMLTKCAAALPRPPWEPILYYSTICIMAFLLFCILVASYFEADRIFTADILRRRAKVTSSQLFDKSRVFDLKTIAGIKQNIPSVDKQPPPPQQQNNHQPAAQPQPQPQQTGGKTPPIIPPMEMSNGHVEFPKKKTPAWSLSEFFKRLFRRNNSSSSSSTTETYNNSSHSDNNSSIKSSANKTSYLPVHNNGSSNGNTRSSAKSGPLLTAENIETANAVSCNAPPDKNYYKNNKKNNRATKRQHSDILLLDVGSALDGNRKIDSNLTNAVVGGKEEKSSYHNKTADNSNKTSRNKDIQDDEPVKNNRRAKRTKSPNNPGQDNSLVKDKLRHSDLFQDEKDDTSSTTTDSSIPDPETSSARESTPEPQPLSKKLKTKKEKKKMEQGMEDDDQGEDEFVITSKSKAHKKIRVDRKSAYGGNIHCPSSLELPYKTKLEAQKESERNSAVNAGQDKIRKVLKNRASKAKTSDMRSRTNSEASDGSNESAPPVWDMPVSQGDLSDLSSQTEQFASRLTNSKVSAGALRGPSPDSVSSGSSYSSVVSNGSAQQNAEINRGKFMEEAKKSPNLQLNITDKHPGAIGSKAWAATSGISNTWLGSNGKDTLASGYGLHGVPENHMSPLTPDTPTSFGNIGQTPDNNMIQQYMYGGLSTPQPPTIMQKLQADRRKRLLDYQQKVINGEEWPGFGLSSSTMQPDSLWSQTMNNHDQASGWPAHSDSPPNPEVSKGLWDISALRSTIPNWQTGGSIWSSAPSAAAAPVTEDLTCTDAGPNAIPSTLPNAMPHTIPTTIPNTIPEMSGSPGGAANMPTFDPFSTLGSIWQPGTSVDNSMNRWPYTPSSLDEDNM